MSTINEINLSNKAKNFSRVISIVLAILITVMAIIIIPYSINEIFGTWIEIKAQIVNDPECVQVPETNLYKCSPLEIVYNTPKKDKKNNMTYNPGIITYNKYKKNDYIDIWYEENTEPHNITFLNQSLAVSGKISLVMLICALIISWGWVYIIHY